MHAFGAFVSGRARRPETASLQFVAQEGSGLSDDTPDGPEGGGKIAEYAAMLQKVPLLRSLTDAERKKIASRLKVIEFEDGDAIVTEGEAGDAMYIVQSGEAQAFVQGNVVMEYGNQKRMPVPPTSQ